MMFEKLAEAAPSDKSDCKETISSERLSREEAAPYLQMSNQTRANRFPKIMETLKQLVPSPKRILSFGCSTGEECQTLAEMFPEAEIMGVDRSYYVLSTAKKNNKNEKIKFAERPEGQFDLITCLMVLFSLERPISRKDFIQAVNVLDRHLNVGGTLAIYTADHDFLDTLAGLRYKSIRNWERVHDRNQKKYHCGYYQKEKDVVPFNCIWGDKFSHPFLGEGI